MLFIIYKCFKFYDFKRKNYKNKNLITEISY